MQRKTECQAFVGAYIWPRIQIYTVASATAVTGCGFYAGDSDYFWDSVGHLIAKMSRNMLKLERKERMLHASVKLL